MKAMIFAAGLGTRLKPLTDTMPKALVSVGGHPLLQILLEKLAAAGFVDIVINVHHFADMIEQWCQEHPVQGIRSIRFSDERQELLETGGGIKHAAPLLTTVTGAHSSFLIHNVDILSNVDLQAFCIPKNYPSETEDALSAEATLLVSERETQRYLIFDPEMRLVGWTNIKTGEVKSPFPAVHAAFDERFVAASNPISIQTSPFFREEGSGPYQLLAFAGIHQMSTSMLPLMANYPDKFSIIDFYLQQCREHVIRGYVQPDLRLMDVGKLDTLSAADNFFLQI